MEFPYFPQTPADVSSMLERCSVKSLDELYGDVPAEFIYRKEYELPEALSELELRRFFDELDSKNRHLVCFAGQGAYDHYSPAVCAQITQRSEFLTAYTPYQCEISQGTLRYIFEYQSMICALTGMDVANASMYDGATAAAEALLMTAASARPGCRKVLASAALLPSVVAVLRTYMGFHGLELVMIDVLEGQSSKASLEAALAEGGVCGVLVPSVNRFGIVENLAGFADACHAAGAQMAVYADPSALAVLRTPAEWGADIACGECQSLGIPMCYGGPYIGFLACRQALMRKLPGRIVGAATDADGKRAFVLTLQAREQHIRREKATSNICSNESLLALYVTVYLSLMGAEGLKRVCALSSEGAHFLHDALLATGKFEDPFPGKPFLKEFALKPLCDAAALRRALSDAGFFGALPTEEGYVTFCVTEKRSREEVERLVEVVKNL